MEVIDLTVSESDTDSDKEDTDKEQSEYEDMRGLNTPRYVIDGFQQQQLAPFLTPLLVVVVVVGLSWYVLVVFLAVTAAALALADI